MRCPLCSEHMSLGVAFYQCPKCGHIVPRKPIGDASDKILPSKNRTANPHLVQGSQENG